MIVRRAASRCACLISLAAIFLTGCMNGHKAENKFVPRSIAAYTAGELTPLPDCDNYSFVNLGVYLPPQTIYFVPAPSPDLVIHPKKIDVRFNGVGTQPDRQYQALYGPLACANSSPLTPNMFCAVELQSTNGGLTLYRGWSYFKGDHPLVATVWFDGGIDSGPAPGQRKFAIRHDPDIPECAVLNLGTLDIRIPSGTGTQLLAPGKQALWTGQYAPPTISNIDMSPGSFYDKIVKWSTVAGMW